MHSGDMAELGGVNLTDAEREALLEVMQRAKDFDDKTQKMNSRLEGTLHKWTNALKGWQPRWLCVDQQQGVLHYYTSEDRKKSPPRGSLHLWGAVIAPSDEDSQTFTVNGANGEVYKLRGADAKERQYWVSRLRNEIERCSSAHAGYVPKSQTRVTSSSAIPSLPISPITTGSGADKCDALSPTSPQHTTPTRKHSRSKRGLAVFTARTSIKKRHKKRRAGPSGEDQEDLGSGLPGGEAMLELLTRLQKFQSSLNAQLESCSGTGIEPLDQNVLLLKATSQAAVHSVKDCLALIKLQQVSSVGKCSVSTVGDISSAVEDGVIERRRTEVGEGGKSSRPLSATECDALPPGAHAPIPVKGPVV